MGGESWIYGYDPETKQHFFAREEPIITKSKKVVASPEVIKEHTHWFFHNVHSKFVPPNNTVNSIFCL
jgi:hypothetical protein